MNKSTAVLVGLMGIVAIMLLGWWGTYNSIVTLDQEVEQSWSQVQIVYQRRADLIPNLVKTVQGYATHEEQVFTAVAEARSKVSQINVDAGALASDPQLQEKFLAAQKELSGTLSRLLAVSENYPQLKANEGFLTLQNQLEGTENRIANERRRNQEATRDFNVKIVRFPATVVASFHGFSKKPYFEASEGADQAPVVSFDN